MQHEEVTNDLFGLVGTFPRPGWIVLDAARSHRFTGELIVETLPVVTVYLDRGEIYLAERITDPSLGSRLIDAGALNAAQLEHGSIRVGEVAHLGRLFERVPSVNRHTVLVMTEMMTEECVGWLAGQLVRGVTSTPYRHHPAGIRRWTQSPRALDLSPGDPLPSPTVGDAAIPTPPPEPLFSPLEAFDDDVITWDQPSWLDERPPSGRDRRAGDECSGTDVSDDAATSSVFDSMPLLPTRASARSVADESPSVDWPPAPPSAVIAPGEPAEPVHEAVVPAGEPTKPTRSQLSTELDAEPAAAPFDLDRRSPRIRPEQRVDSDQGMRERDASARSSAAAVTPSTPTEASPQALATPHPTGARTDRPSSASLDRFEVIWPSGEIDDQLGTSGTVSTTDGDLDDDRTGSSGPSDDAAAPIEATARVVDADAEAPVGDDDGSEVSDDVVLAVRRAVASIETGSLITRRRLAEASPGTDLSRGVDSSSDRLMSSTPPGRRVMQHEWAPGVNSGRAAPIRSVFDEMAPVAPPDEPVPVLPPVDAPAPSSRDRQTERVGALRRLIGSLRRH